MANPASKKTAASRSEWLRDPASLILLIHTLIEVPVAWFYDPEAMLPLPEHKNPNEEEEVIKPAQLVAVRSFALAIFCLGCMSWRALSNGDKQLQRFVMQMLPIYHVLYAFMIVYHGLHPDVHYPVIGPVTLFPETWKQWMRSEWGIWVSWWEHQLKIWAGFAVHFCMAAVMLWLTSSSSSRKTMKSS